MAIPTEHRKEFYRRLCEFDYELYLKVAEVTFAIAHNAGIKDLALMAEIEWAIVAYTVELLQRRGEDI